MTENPTTNHDLNRPPTGSETGTDDTNWGTELNTNASTLDELLVVRDTDANTSDYTPFTNALYYATDTEQWYIGDGTGWIEIPWLSESPTFTSLTTTNSTVKASQDSGGSPTAGLMFDSSGSEVRPFAALEDADGTTWENGIVLNEDYSDNVIKTPNWELTSLGMVSRGGTVIENVVGPQTSAYTVAELDETVFVDSSGGGFDVTLASVYNYTGMRKKVKDHGGAAGTNSVNIVTDDSATIDGQDSYTLSSNYESVTLVGDGTNWYTI